MRVAIITLPLMDNYGGILQNYALQQVLRELGHDPFTIDLLPMLGLKWYFRGILRMLVKGMPYRRLHKTRLAAYDAIVREYIKKTPVVYRYRESLLRDVDALVVGSDQVWRFLYNENRLPGMFLRFACGFRGRRIAYAASFGTDVWDAPERMKGICAKLVRRFDRVSVREESGVGICRLDLGVDAVQMPDPVLLLPKSAYLEICRDVPVCKDGYIAAYVLDNSPLTEKRIRELQSESGCPVRRFSSGASSTMGLAGWLALFRDACHVVTDSFHGALVSRILGKPYTLLVNEERGAARFRQLEAIGDLQAESERGRQFLRDSLA